MKGLDKGPKIELSKLKPSELKVPGPLRDLWNDLRSQRLLPVVAILIVGLVAIPVLLGGSSKSTPEAVANPAGAAGEAGPSDLVVSKFAPGLRDYRLRYGDRQGNSPFASPHAPKSTEASSGGGEASSPELTESTEPSGGSEVGPEEITEPPIEESPATEPGEKEHHGPTAEEEKEKAIEESTIDVRVTALHLDGTSSDSVRRNLEKLDPVPSKATPALLYAGPSEDGKAATLAVSTDVTDLLGRGSCIDAGEPCKLLELKLGQPETLVFGPRGLTYRVELIRIGTHSLSSDAGGGKGNSPSASANGGSNQGKSPAPEENGGGKLEHLSRHTIAVG